MKASELIEVNKESYDKWFERWYEKENLPAKLKQSAMQGYEAFSYTIGSSFTSYTYRRMDDERFIEKLKEKLDGFNVYRRKSERLERSLFGRHYGYYWTDPEVVISWRDASKS